MNNKLIRLFIALVWVALPALVQAQFTFTTNNGAITITGYNTAAGLNVVIPAATNGYPVTSIGEAAFAAHSLTSVTIPNGVTNIGGNAFVGCHSLTNITVAVANPAYSSLNGVLFDKSQATLLQFPGGLGGDYTIPSSVTNIGGGAFIGCASLTSVTIPNSVTNIGDSAFFGCASLTSVTIPNSVTSIGDAAFEGCTSLTSAYFLGNAPFNDGTAFTGSPSNDPATVYYLAGTTGWGSTFGGVPAVLWNPKAKAISFTGGHFGFTLTGPTNAVIVVEACTNLSQSVWLPVSTNTLSGSGTSAFSDPAGYPMRYYRFRSP